MSVEHTVSSEVSTDLIDPFYNVDEKEADDINSCLNFLSILDDDETTDSCNFTLFRKKDDKQIEILDRDYKTKEPTEYNANNTKEVSDSAVVKASSLSREGESQTKTDINSDKSENVNIKSPNSTKKIGVTTISPILVPVKNADSSFVKKSNIILKIPSLSPKYSSVQKKSLQIDNSKLSQNINCTEFKILKKLKVRTVTKDDVSKNLLMRKSLQYVKDGEVLLKKRIILPSVSAARKPIIQIVEPPSSNILNPLPSTLRQHGIEERSELVCNKKHSEDAYNLESHNILNTCSYDKGKTGNESLLKNSITVSHKNDSQNKLTVTSKYENTVRISNSIKISEPEISGNVPRNFTEIPYRECENEINIQKKDCQNGISIHGKENQRGIIWEKESKNEISMQEKEYENEKTMQKNEHENEVSIQQKECEGEISIEEKECRNEKGILENECETEVRLQENKCENEINIEKTSIEFENEANVLQDSLEISYPELGKNDNVYNIPHSEPEVSKHSNKNLNLNTTEINFFNSFSSVEITQSSLEENRKEKPKKSKVKTRIHAASKRKQTNLKTNVRERIIAPSERRKTKTEQTNSNKYISKVKISDVIPVIKNIKNTFNNKPKTREMYKPLKRMELPTFLKHNNLQGKEELKKDNKIPDSRNKESSLSNVARDSDANKTEGSLVIDEASCTSSLNSDHTSDSLFILRESYSDSNCITRASDMIDQIHNYCHSPRLITNENSTNSSSANDNYLNSYINDDSRLETEEFKSGSSEVRNILNSLTGDADYVSLQPLDNSQFSEHMFLSGYETVKNIHEPEFPSVDFNEISKTLITSEESIDQPEQNSVDFNEISNTTISEKTSDPARHSFSILNSETSNTIEERALYSYNKSSPLSFTVQNVLENMFKYESFPSSANMGRLAKLIGIHWKSIRNWFVARRTLSKKNGLYLRNQPLTNCSYCPNANDIGNDNGIVHLLSKEHIQNMVASFKKHNKLFSEVHDKICERFDSEENSKVNIDLTREQKKLEKIKEIKKNSTKNVEVNKECLMSNEKCNNKVKIDDDKVKMDSAHINDEAAMLMSKINIPPRLPGASDRVKIIDGVGYIISEDTPDSDSSINRSPVNEIKTKEKHKPIECFKSKDDDNLLKKYRANSNEKYPLKMDRNSMLKMSFDTKLVLGYRCPDCFKIFSTEWMLIKHSLLHKKFICSECDEVFSMEEQLKYHLKEHLIESMDEDLYKYYACFRCFNLNCICSQETCEIPYFGNKRYIRPQKARRTEPFRSMPYSGVNDHLKVTWEEFWNKYKKKQISSPYERESSEFLNKEKLSPTKSDFKKIGNKICSTPTYTNITTFNCYLCESFFFTHDELEEHLTVHKIQANKRRKKSKEMEENKKPKKLKVEDNTQSLKKFVCYYCNKNFKTHTLLFKHFKLFCKSLPVEINPNNNMRVERIGRSNKFKLKTENSLSKTFTTSSNKSLTMTKCELCEVKLPPDKVASHRKICTGQSNAKSPDKPTTIDFKDYDYWEGTEKGLYLCKFCNIPLESPILIIMHIGGSCSKAPSEIVSEVNDVTYRSEEHDHYKYYKLIKRTDFDKIIPLEKIKLMLDLSSFLPVEGQDKRIRCKFCEKYPYKRFLKLHLTKHCKYVPKELRDIIILHQSTIFSAPKITEEKSLDSERSHNNKSRVDSSLKPVVKSSESELTLTSHETPDNSGQSTLASSVIFYDCHLCEKKFGISKDFIAHMQNIHCISISDKSCYKWLSKVDKNGRVTNLEKASPDTLYDQQEEDSFLTFDSIGSEIIEESLTEIDLSKEVTLESLDDESMIEETKTESDLNKDDSIEILPNETEGDVSSLMLTAAPNKGQKLDDELLNEDFEQFGNFIETVQLEDSAFANASSS